MHILPHTTHPSQFFNVTPVINNSYRNLCNVARRRWDADERKWTNSDNKYYMYTFDFVMHAIVLKVLPSQIKICSLATISLCTSKCSKLVLRHTCKNQKTPRVWVYRIEIPRSVIKVKMEKQRMVNVSKVFLSSRKLSQVFQPITWWKYGKCFLFPLENTLRKSKGSQNFFWLSKYKLSLLASTAFTKCRLHMGCVLMVNDNQNSPTIKV